MASSADIGEAYNRGYSAGQNAAMGKQPRVVSAAMYNTYLGGSDDPELRSSFNNGFYSGYDAAAKGMGPSAEKELAKVTKAEEAKAPNPFGARQTELGLNYDDFDKTVQAEKASYVTVDGGLAFLSDWQMLKSQWNIAKNNELNESYLEYYEQQLRDMQSRRDSLAAGKATYGTTTESTPGISTWETLPSWEAPPTKMTDTATPGAKPGAPGTPAAAGKILGLSKPVFFVGLAVLLGGGAAAAWVATKEDPKKKPGPPGPQFGPRPL